MIPPPDRPDLALALSYARQGREGANALFALDRQLGTIVARATEPLIGQMRLTWWREAIEKLDSAPSPAEPILQALSAHVLPAGVSGAALARIADGWEALLEDPFGVEAVSRHGERGKALFAALAHLTRTTDPHIVDAGRGWALADLSRNLSASDLATAAGDRARVALDIALSGRWSRNGRAIGALAVIARADLDNMPPVRRIARLMRLRVSGR